MSAPRPQTLPARPAEHPLLTAVEDAHERAALALEDGAGMDAVVWLSAHLAAAHRSLQPAATRTREDRSAQRRRRMLDLRLERLLRTAERHHSGDAQAAGVDGPRIDEMLRVALAEHARAERALLDHLTSMLPGDALDDLLTSYGEHLRHAPTRPHPHAPHRGLLGAAAFRIDAWRDHLMDTMDSRHVPAPRVPRHPATPGRWGHYMLGDMDR